MLFRGASLCDYSGSRVADLRTKGGKIIEIGKLSPKPKEEVVDVRGKIILPALIDLSVAPKAMSLSSKALSSLSKKAIAGGVGTMLLNPFTNPPCSENGAIELIKGPNAELLVHLLPAINPLNAESKLSDIASLSASGGRAIFAKSDYDANALMCIAQYATMLDIPLFCFCQDSSLAYGVINEGILSASLGLPSIPENSQTKEVVKIAEMLHALPLKLVLDMLVYPRSIALLKPYRESRIDSSKGAKNTESSKVFTQSSIHHFILDESICQDYNTAGKLNPPLVDRDSIKILLKQLKDDDIDMLSAMQCADYNSKKDQVFELASFGIDALNIYFPLLYTFLHKAHNIPLALISKLTSYNQARLLGLNKGALEPGKLAELIIINPTDSIAINDVFSPYHKARLNGIVEAFVRNEALHRI